jgi:DNA polymerase
MIKDAPEEIVKVLELRQQISKSSVKKYLAMKNAGCVDNRARVCFNSMVLIEQKMGRKNYTIQNLPQNHIEDLKEAREL